jgi:predicted GH43/DUF377 family glycosyl hydrolase
VQAAGVLLQRSLPGNGHRQHQGIERGMVEAFADELSGRQQDARRVGWQARPVLTNEGGALLLRHSAV